MNDIKAVYFVGIGGIGMSAIARFYLSKGLPVGGYDRTPSPLTEALATEGAWIHYEDDIEAVPPCFKDPDHTLVVWTPAIPASHGELSYFQTFRLQKRAQVLGTLSMGHRALCVAGTHGKTTTSSMTAHILHEGLGGCNAFLGGITKNYGTNYLLAPQSEWMVIEADEFDRSFHHLRPWATVVTSTDADHLDIYGTEEAYLESFAHYTSLIREGGAAIIHTQAKFTPRIPHGVRTFSYGPGGDFRAENIRIGAGRIVFDMRSPLQDITDVELGVPVKVNIDNGVAAMALAQLAGVGAGDIRRAMLSFGGVDRRFDYHVRRPDMVYLSDYAHHPAEVRACLESLKALYDGKRIRAIFQPHLYTRTRDFYADFASALSTVDDVVLLDIYPAREEPIPGVTSELIQRHLSSGVRSRLCSKAEVMDVVCEGGYDVLVTLGAGDLDNMAADIAAALTPNQPTA